MSQEETVEEYKERVARSGGKGLFRKIGKKGMSKLGKKGMAKRWKTKKKLKIQELLFD